jgi:hypothetical protein
MGSVEEFMVGLPFRIRTVGDRPERYSKETTKGAWRFARPRLL